MPGARPCLDTCELTGMSKRAASLRTGCMEYELPTVMALVTSLFVTSRQPDALTLPGSSSKTESTSCYILLLHAAAPYCTSIFPQTSATRI